MFKITSCLPKIWLQYYCAATATIPFFTNGLTLGWSSTALSKLVDGPDAMLTDDQASWLVVTPLVVTFVITVTLSSGTIINKLGRKTFILLMNIPTLIAWLLIAFGNRAEYLFVARTLCGLSDAVVFTVTPIYLGEIADANKRGFIGSLPSVGIILGVVTMNAIGQYQSIYTTALICAGVPIIQFILFLFAPESPYYHIMHDQYEEAKQSMRRLKGVEDVDVEFIRVTEAIQADQNRNGRFADLFTVASNRKALIAVLGPRTIQQFSGIFAITAYSTDILTMKHLVVIYFGVQLLMSCVSSFIVDVAGRKPLLFVSAVGTGLASGCAAIYFYLQEKTDLDLACYYFVPITTMLIYIVMHSVGLTTIPLMMVGEVFSSDIKPFAVAVTNAYFCLCATAAVQFYYVATKYVGMYVAFTGFSICSFLGAIFVINFVPETKGKTLEEVVDYFRGNTDSCKNKTYCDP